MREAFRKKGFSFIEVIAPCPTLYERRNKLGDGLDMMNYFKEQSEVRHGADPKEVGVRYQGPLVVGKFVDIERPTFLDLMNRQLERTLEAHYAGCAEDHVRS